MAEPDRDLRRTDRLVGLAVYGAALAGIGGLGVVLAALVTEDPLAAGAGLIASAIAFGSLANALLRR